MKQRIVYIGTGLVGMVFIGVAALPVLIAVLILIHAFGE